MKNEPIVSIIIPVYNAEKYIAKCLDSILVQTFTEFEVILIDDGSKDESANIYNKYAKNDCRIKPLRQENSGVSAARNKGIDTAKGKYILFVDADDYIVEDMVEKLVDAAEKTQSDLAFCGFKVLGSDLRSNDTMALCNCCGPNNDFVVSKEEVIKRIVSTAPNEMLYGYIWRNLFRTEVIKTNKIKFIQGIKISEDFLFILEMANHSNHIVIIPEELYIYNINSGSVTSKYIPSMHHDMSTINMWIEKNICNGMPSVVDGYNCCVANTYLSHVQNLCRLGSPYKIRERFALAYKIKKQYKYDATIKKVWKSRNKFRKKAWIGMIMFRFKFDWLYILLFTYKERKS